MQQILTPPSGNYKINKSKAFGWLTWIMHFAPAEESGRNVCPASTAGCRAACLYTAGHGTFHNVKSARIAKTTRYFTDKKAFETQLIGEIGKAVNKAQRRGYLPAFRLNGTSDLPALARKVAKLFPTVQFYDYTAIPLIEKRELPNYALCFSHKGPETIRESLRVLENGGRVAVVFNVKRNENLPVTYWGFPVVNGDLNDLIFLHQGPVIIGLRAKGQATKDKTGFVVQV